MGEIWKLKIPASGSILVPMSAYQVIARRYRPKFFGEVVGHRAILTTLKNSLAKGRVGHAYLFSGSRGTGKTTLARLLAKALNCSDRAASGEPCGLCPSCDSIAKGSSLSLIEIDGASHRGIDDVRQLQETISLMAPAPYKIYLIDEVHMLTKEAFNALLKSLEEPPPHVKFFFATTEPEKVPLTILSRCQHFPLFRLTEAEIEGKLKEIAADIGIEIEKGALERLARLSQGSLRDGSSMLDEAACYFENRITLKALEELFGLIDQESLAALDQALLAGRIDSLLHFVDRFFLTAKNPEHLVDELVVHFRGHLLAHIDNKQSCYQKEHCLDILEELSRAAEEIRSAFSPKSYLELLLIRLSRTAKKISFEQLTERLIQLEKRLIAQGATPEPSSKGTSPQRHGDLRGSTEGEKIERDGERPLEQSAAPSTESRLSSKGTSPQRHRDLRGSTEGEKIERDGERSLEHSSSSEPGGPSQQIAVPVTRQRRTPESGHSGEEKLPEQKEPPEEGESVLDKQRRKSRYDTALRFAAKELSGMLKMEGSK